MAFSVAKDPKFAPAVIYLDDCEIYFQSSKKKKKKSHAALKLQKDLLIYKNQCLSPKDRVLVIGCSRCPWDADTKTMKWKGPTGGKPEKQGTIHMDRYRLVIDSSVNLFWYDSGFFERSIHVPCPTHADRMVLWKHFVKDSTAFPSDKDLNYSLLAHESEGRLKRVRIVWTTSLFISQH